MLEGRFDGKLLGPGWAGEISDDEVFFIQEELLRDKKLAYQWGFAPSRRTRPAGSTEPIGQGASAIRNPAENPPRSRHSNRASGSRGERRAWPPSYP